MLVALGVLLRPNAIVAAPLLAAYVAWPSAFHWKRVATVLIPGIVAGYALIHVAYYTVLNAERLYPLHSVFVFDLGGVSYYSGENRFPVAFTPEQTAMLLSDTCYKPERWDYYWHIAPCDFVMRRLERKDDKVFGTPRLVEAWRDAVLSDPIAYLKHRATFMRTFLSRDVLLIPVLDLNEPSRQVHARNPLFMAMIAVQNVLQPTWLLSLGFWLAIAIAGVRVRLADPRHAIGRVRARRDRIGRRLRAVVLSVRGRRRFSLRLLVRAGESGGRRGRDRRSPCRR